ncbi:MAG: outer membrane beta-barrel protein [Pseudomonadota bacterium]
MNFRKTLLAISLSACTGAAVAADKVPTLGEVLNASGITVNGYVDFSHNNLSTDVGSNTYRVFDTENRGFKLQMLDLSIGYLPASGFGGFVQLNAGDDARAIASAGTSADDFEAQEAYLQYANGGLSVIAGKFATLAGAELIESPSNTNFSRSILFGYAIPFTHTGVRASYAVNDAIKLIAGLNNGWDVMRETQQTAAADGQRAMSKTVELGVIATPAKMLSLAASYYTGKESSGTTTPADRNVLDFVATINATDALSFVLNYDKGEQESVGGTTAKWDGIAGYVNYKLSDEYRLSLRTESFKDKQGYRTGTTQKLKETTLTLGYAPAKNVELRAEYRKDKSDQNVFTEDGTAKKSQDSLGLEAIYKF